MKQALSLFSTSKPIACALVLAYLVGLCACLPFSQDDSEGAASAYSEAELNLDSFSCPDGQLRDSASGLCFAASSESTVVYESTDFRLETESADLAVPPSAGVPSASEIKVYTDLISSLYVQPAALRQQPFNEAFQAQLNSLSKGSEAETEFFAGLLNEYYGIWKGFHRRAELISKFEQVDRDTLAQCALDMGQGLPTVDCVQSYLSVAPLISDANRETPLQEQSVLESYEHSLQSLWYLMHGSPSQIAIDHAEAIKFQEVAPSLLALFDALGKQLLQAQQYHRLIHLEAFVDTGDGIKWAPVGRWAESAAQAIADHVAQGFEQTAYQLWEFRYFIEAVRYAVDQTVTLNSDLLKKSQDWPLEDAWQLAIVADSINLLERYTDSENFATLSKVHHHLLAEWQSKSDLPEFIYAIGDKLGIERSMDAMVIRSALLCAGVSLAGALIAGPIGAFWAGMIACLPITAFDVYQLVVLSELATASVLLSNYGIEDTVALVPISYRNERVQAANIASLAVLIDAASIGLDVAEILSKADEVAEGLERASRIYSGAKARMQGLLNIVNDFRHSERLADLIYQLQLDRLRLGAPFISRAGRGLSSSLAQDLWQRAINTPFGEGLIELGVEIESMLPELTNYFKPSRYISDQQWLSLGLVERAKQLDVALYGGIEQTIDWVPLARTPEFLDPVVQIERYNSSSFWEITFSKDFLSNTLDALSEKFSRIADIVEGLHIHISFPWSKTAAETESENVVKLWVLANEKVAMKTLAEKPRWAVANGRLGIPNFADLQKAVALLKKMSTEPIGEALDWLCKYNWVGLRHSVYEVAERIGLEIRGRLISNEDKMDLAAHLMQSLESPHEAIALGPGARGIRLDDVSLAWFDHANNVVDDPEVLRVMLIYEGKDISSLPTYVRLPLTRWEERGYLQPFTKVITEARETFLERMKDIATTTPEKPSEAELRILRHKVTEAISEWSQKPRLWEHYYLPCSEPLVLRYSSSKKTLSFYLCFRNS
ncbi:MAG: hypothetical protein IPJ88_02865 [Myxococcales bacterium]|nr:MAG: hypothetical protein IPJ88_02865 [Myxococcales bacterium]